MTDEQTKQTILGFTEFFKGITGNQNLEIPSEISEKFGIQTQAKALQYDRNQYNKGYTDAKTEMQNKINAAIKEIEQIREVHRADWYWYVDAADAMSKVIDILKNI